METQFVFYSTKSDSLGMYYIVPCFLPSVFTLLHFSFCVRMCRHSMIWFPNEGSQPNSQEARDLEVSSKLVESYQLCSAKLRRLLKVWLRKRWFMNFSDFWIELYILFVVNFNVVDCFSQIVLLDGFKLNIWFLF